MFCFVLLSCLFSGIALGEETGINSISDIPEERGGQVASGNKYFLYHIKVDWFQALDLCFQMDQRLATFDNQEEYKQIVSLIRRENGNDLKANYWTGGSDLGEKNKYFWMITGKPLTYTNWWYNEPTHGVWFGEMERCIDIVPEYNFKMNDNRCSKRNYVICEAVPS